jgi:hypothetical protein
MAYIVDYSYRDGGNFKKSFPRRADALALCLELMMQDSVSWVQCLRGDKRIFPSQNTQRCS